MTVVDTTLTLSPSELSVLLTALSTYRSDYEGLRSYEDDAEAVDDLIDRLERARGGDPR